MHQLICWYAISDRKCSHWRTYQSIDTVFMLPQGITGSQKLASYFTYDNFVCIWTIIIYTRNDQHIWNDKHNIIFSCDQAALWMVFSVRLSVCLSVTPFWLCSHHRIITKFSGVITNDRSDVHAKVQGQRSRSRSQRSTANLAVSTP